MFVKGTYFLAPPHCLYLKCSKTTSALVLTPFEWSAKIHKATDIEDFIPVF